MSSTPVAPSPPSKLESRSAQRPLSQSPPRSAPPAQPSSRFVFPRLKRRISSLILAPLLLSCSVLTTSAIQPSLASDHLLLSYGPIQLPLSLDSLEAYAQSGTMDSELSPYLERFSPRLQRRLRQSLQTQLQLPPQQVRQFLQSPMGERLLSSATVFAVQPDVLQQAIIQAAENGNGLSLINILRQFPQTAQIDLQQAGQLWQRYGKLARRTQTFMQILDQPDERSNSTVRMPTPMGMRAKTTAVTSAQKFISSQKFTHTKFAHTKIALAVEALHPHSLRTQSFSPRALNSDGLKAETLSSGGLSAEALYSQTPELEDLRQSGPLKLEQRSLQLYDHQRDRTLAVDLYLPAATSTTKSPRKAQGSGWAQQSLVILSHGLGANRQGHAFFARHLASHGIAAAVLQHPGSDSEQLQAMLQGQTQTAMEINSFVERPRDVSYLLDELERRNPTEFDGQLNLEKVGIYGHSLGAYTALTLAGATLNFDQLQADCNPEAYLLDLSLVLQCQALELPQRDYQLQDPRIAALLLLDPVSRSILAASEASPGLSAVRVPVFWGGSNADVVTPLAAEQLPAFEQLGSQRKYLSLIKGIQHMNIQLDRLSTTQDLSDNQLVQAKPQAFQDYINALGLAFVQVYVGDRPEYKTYLQASYANQLSQTPHAIRLLTPEKFQALNP